MSLEQVGLQIGGDVLIGYVTDHVIVATKAAKDMKFIGYQAKLGLKVMVIYQNSLVLAALLQSLDIMLVSTSVTMQLLVLTMGST